MKWLEKKIWTNKEYILGMIKFERRHCVDSRISNSRYCPYGYLFNNEKYCYGDLKKQFLQ